MALRASRLEIPKSSVAKVIWPCFPHSKPPANITIWWSDPNWLVSVVGSSGLNLAFISHKNKTKQQKNPNEIKAKHKTQKPWGGDVGEMPFVQIGDHQSCGHSCSLRAFLTRRAQRSSMILRMPRNAEENQKQLFWKTSLWTADQIKPCIPLLIWDSWEPNYSQ